MPMAEDRRDKLAILSVGRKGSLFDMANSRRATLGITVLLDSMAATQHP